MLTCEVDRIKPWCYLVSMVAPIFWTISEIPIVLGKLR